MLHPNELTAGKSYRAPNGYIHISCKGHPNHSNGRILEHRFVMECHLGRFLKRGEEVHHKNEKRDDNRLENLQLFSTVKEHRQLHKPPRPCEICGEIHNYGLHKRTHCSKCGKIIRLGGRLKSPPVCWRCTFPIRKCEQCGSAKNVWKTKHNGETRLLCENHGKKWKRKLVPAAQQKRKRGTKHPHSKWTEAQVRHCRKLLSQGVLHKEISKITGIAKGSVGAIAQRRVWSHLK